ncbi:hypothetical protein AYO20_01233 [Fonsecaea nubica]|uniref:RRM domain-containing protein n=1 Tax=Fonsecaea nubica TaxID=856822 RepID=A0A178DDR6_9EURO|nr:hypothetical protein AYO20_01233 [Fonsecaea nubica]OAL39363.1 hypothetical protein AYO20_01233 [Fonsecaea nubica]
MASHRLDEMAESITIPTAEYASLVSIYAFQFSCQSRPRAVLTEAKLDTRNKFRSLVQGLLNAGVSGELLDALSRINRPLTPPNDFNSTNVNAIEPSHNGAPGTGPMHTARSFVPPVPATEIPHLRQHAAGLQAHLGPGMVQDAPQYAEGNATQEVVGVSSRQNRDGMTTARRSLVILGLSPATTLHSIAQVLRGGAILQMYLRRQDCSAHVSFVDPKAADNFYHYARTNDIYVAGDRVDIRWDHRQTQVQPSFADFVQLLSRTRNLVIRSASPEMTEDSIRADLEHIHHLDVVDLFFRDGHAHISLNSIKSAHTAKNCMLSRQKYMRSRIDFYPDECARPLPRADLNLRQNPSAVNPAGVFHNNRFAVLFDESEES